MKHVRRKETLFIIYYRLDIGGIQTKIIDIINHLERKRPSLRIVLIVRGPYSISRVDEIKHSHLILRYYPDTLWCNLPYVFPLYVLVLTYIYRPRSILAFTFIPALCAIWAKLLYVPRRIQVVLSEDWSRPDELSGELQKGATMLKHIAFRLFYSRADIICVVNNTIKQLLIDKYALPEKKVVRVYNWHSSAARLSRTKHRDYDVIYTGRLNKTKNVRYILSIIQRLVGTMQNVTLCVVGTGPEEDRLRRYVERHGLSEHVVFTGYVSDPVKYMKRSSVCMLASKSEGLPLAALDAMACGLPLLAAGYPSVDEVIIHGYNGYVYTSTDDCVQFLLRLLQSRSLRKTFGDNGRALARTSFDRSNIDSYIRYLHL